MTVNIKIERLEGSCMNRMQIYFQAIVICVKILLSPQNAMLLIS